MALIVTPEEQAAFQLKQKLTDARNVAKNAVELIGNALQNGIAPTKRQTPQGIETMPAIPPEKIQAELGEEWIKEFQELVKTLMPIL